MTRVRPSSTVQLESSSANWKRAGRSSKGARPSMRCPSFRACICVGAEGIQQRLDSKVSERRRRRRQERRQAQLRFATSPKYLEDEVSLIVGQGGVGVALQGSKGARHVVRWPWGLAHETVQQMRRLLQWLHARKAFWSQLPTQRGMGGEEMSTRRPSEPRRGDRSLHRLRGAASRPSAPGPHRCRSQGALAAAQRPVQVRPRQKRAPPRPVAARVLGLGAQSR